MENNRKAGVLLGVASLPGRFGIGDFGPSAYRFLEDLHEAGFAIWQILPLAPLGYGHSPYQPYSSFAMDELYADLDALYEEGLLKEKAPSFQPGGDKIAYEEIRPFKQACLRKAFFAEMRKDPDCLNRFASAHPWAKDYAVFDSFHQKRQCAWMDWPKAEKDWILTRPALSQAKQKEASFRLYVQYKLYQQWDKLHEYAKKLGIQIVGDLPFYVGIDSCDVWANQGEFLLDPETKAPTFIAGVPPDYFSATGQRWGNPIYDWDRMQKEKFSFIIDRILRNADIYDILRLDHFRAFDTYWKIPSSCPTAVEGEWIEAPGYALFDELFARKPGLPIIAEDLGDLRPEVLTLRDHYHFPGMNVIQFTFHDFELEGKGNWDEPNSVVYLGTHDNDTTLSFFYSQPEEEQARWVYALQRKGIAEGSICERLITYALEKKAALSILSMQDILELDAEARTNVPGTVDNRNWTWKISSLSPFEERLPYLSSLLEKSGRKPR